MKPSFLPRSAHFKAMIRRDGALNVRAPRERRTLLGDLYHYFFSLSWLEFFCYVFAVYITINFMFAMFYFGLDVHPAAAAQAQGWQRFEQCFFLSVETLTAIEYDRIVSSGAIVYVLMTLQAILGILTLATITSLFFARFSRPTARLIFSNKAIIGMHNGKQYLYFRVANQRLNQIAEAHMTLTFTRNEISKEGEHNRKFYDLQLERDYSPLFALSWTVRHPLDKQSPLYGLDAQTMKKGEIGLLASLTGVDETFSQPIMARHVYTAEDLVTNKRFKDIIQWHDRKVYIDLKGIHEVVDAQPAAGE